MSDTPKYIIVKAKDTVLQDGKIPIMVKGESYLIPLGWIKTKIKREFISIVEDNVDDIWKPYDININLTGKKLLVQRSSGVGDLVFISPLLQYIKDKYPTCYIGVACTAYYHPILRAIPNINRILPVPLPLSSMKGFDYHLSFMWAIESETGSETDENCYDTLYKVLDVNPAELENKYKSPILKDLAPTKIEHKNLVGIQPFSGAPIRDIPQPLVLNLIKELNKRGKTVFIIASQDEHRLIELTNLTKDMKVVYPSNFKNMTDIYEVCKLIKNCEFIITSDSSFAHIGPGLGIKTISIYGPFSAKSRTGYYKKSWSIDTQPSCRCRFHTMGICPHGKYPSPCMDIDISLILNVIDYSMQNPTG